MHAIDLCVRVFCGNKSGFLISDKINRLNRFFCGNTPVVSLSLHSGEGWDERQPDGGMLELCVQIVMRNFHSTDHWHDIPCVSKNEASQYICMKQTRGKVI